MADTAHSGTSITGGHTNAVASGAAGFMSGTDKAKLDGISASADVTATALPAALPTDHMRAITTAFYATTAAIAANTYNNGTAGVGATLTGNANGALATIDGQSPAASDIVFIKDEATGANNGVYQITQLGDAGTPYILTRVVAADTASKLAGCRVHVRLGTANANTNWCLNLTAASITVGSTALTFVSDSTSATVPAALGTAAAGTSPHLARRDHVHTLPSVDGLAATAGDVAMVSHGLTGLRAAVAAGESVRWEQTDRIITDWRDANTGSSAADRFVSANTNATNPGTTESDSQIVMPCAGTLRSLYVALLTAGTTTDSQVFCVRVNGVDTAITCTLAQGVQTGNDTAHTASFNAGDKVSIRVTQSGTENKAVGIRCSVSWRQ